MTCPKCRRELKASGEVTDADGSTLKTYQCDECTVPWPIGGETIDAALTFAVRPGGILVDPADPGRELNLN